MVTDYVEIPQCILDLNKSEDVMFVNMLGLFVSISRQIKFTTLEYMHSRTKGKLGNLIIKVISLYNTSGFKIRILLMDRDFD